MTDTPRTDVDHVLVVGAGLMGSGIAQVVATSGRAVSLVDLDEATLTAGMQRITTSLARFVRAGKLSEERADEVAAAITPGTELAEPAARADLVIEAIIEALEPKQALFASLEELCAPDVILATNTSQFPIGSVAARVASSWRVLGMHWSNPPPMMPLVEIVVGDHTDPAVVTSTQAFLASCDRESVICRKDVPGFISNRLSTVLFMEAVRLVDEGVASPEDIDRVATQMYGHRMGPIATLDLAGLDTALRVATALTEHYGGDRFDPAPVLARLVADGHHGRKTGEGFYEH